MKFDIKIFIVFYKNYQFAGSRCSSVSIVTRLRARWAVFDCG